MEGGKRALKKRESKNKSQKGSKREKKRRKEQRIKERRRKEKKKARKRKQKEGGGALHRAPFFAMQYNASYICHVPSGSTSTLKTAQKILRKNHMNLKTQFLHNQ